MAWISVDQKLIGGKLRSLYKAIGCSQNEAIGILITLWLWGIDNAEMDGLIVSADRSDIAGVLQTGLSSSLDAESVVESLIDSGWIDDVEGQLYLHDWEDWRSYYNRYIKEKESNAKRQSKYKARKRMEREENGESNVTSDVTGNVTENGKDQGGQPETPENQEHSGGKQESKYGPEFEEFWKIYPRKVDKGQAFKTYKSRIKDGFSPEDLKQAAEAYRRQCEREHTEQKFIKHAKTFLGTNLSFTEYIPKKAEPEQQQTGGGTSGQYANPFRRGGK